MQVRRADEPRGRLARDELDRGDGAFRGGAHRVEPDQRSRREQDAGARPCGPLDQFHMVEQRTGAQRNENASRLDRGRGDGAKRHRRRAFDDHVAMLRKRRDRHHPRRDAVRRKPRFRRALVAGRSGGERKSGYPGAEPARDRHSDRAQSRKPDAQFRPVRQSKLLHHHPSPSPDPGPSVPYFRFGVHGLPARRLAAPNDALDS